MNDHLRLFLFKDLIESNPVEGKENQPSHFIEVHIGLILQIFHYEENVLVKYYLAKACTKDFLLLQFWWT